MILSKKQLTKNSKTKWPHVGARLANPSCRIAMETWRPETLLQRVKLVALATFVVKLRAPLHSLRAPPHTIPTNKAHCAMRSTSQANARWWRPTPMGPCTVCHDGTVQLGRNHRRETTDQCCREITSPKCSSKRNQHLDWFSRIYFLRHRTDMAVCLAVSVTHMTPSRNAHFGDS